MKKKNVQKGRPGTDYPILSAMPYTNFYCDEQSYPGFFADIETRCQGILRKKKKWRYISCCELFQSIFQVGTIVI